MQRQSTRRYDTVSFFSVLQIVTLLITFMSPALHAMPSFSRQTGMACSQCHTQAFGPNLTPFGRDFKLGGYTMEGGSGTNAKLPPISAMITGSFTNTNKVETPPDSPTGYNENNNFTFDEASLFYAGKIYGNVGAFSQLTYNGYDDKLEMDKTDIRYADQFELADLPFTFGVSLNNTPTVSDLWNTGTWGFPYTGSGIQPGAGSSALIDGGLDAQVGGASAYTMINNLVYLEAGAYASFSPNFQRTFGIAAPDRLSLAGPAPYWRVALQHDWKGHFFAVGHYGLNADVVPGRDSTFGANHYTDIAFDATYQFMANTKHIFEAKTAYIYEDQRLSSDRLAENDPNSGKTYLTTLKFNAAYTFDQTYGVTFGYNKINGSRGPIFVDGVDNGQSKPNSEYFTAELVYVPFGKSTSMLSPWLNLRTSLQYIGYTQANGTSTLSQDINTFMVNGWLAF